MVAADFIVIVSFILLVLTLAFAFIAKRRMDRNEPVWGWQRKQFLEEQRTGGQSSQDVSKKAAYQQKEDKEHESILELLELKKIEHGVIERDKNEFLLFLNTDFVNFDLLQPGERLAILEGYQQLYNVTNFPIQLLVQAVRQDFSKERFRFEKSLSRCNVHVVNYNSDVLDHIEKVTEHDFRITLRIFYVVKYIYEPSKLAKLTKEQRDKNILENVAMRAEIVRRALRRAKVEAKILNSLSAAEVLKRALNRDRMILHPIELVQEDEKLSPFVTMDFSTIPDFEALVNNLEEAVQIVGINEESEKSSIQPIGV